MNDERLVLGVGPVARVLGAILGSPVVPRTHDDRAWAWPPLQQRDERRLLFVLAHQPSPAGVIRLHSEAWECPKTDELTCTVYGLTESERNILAKRDVFGRVSAEGETFEDWSRYVALLSRSAGLPDILRSIDQLSTCFVESWRDRATTASLVPHLQAAIRDRNATLLRELADRAVLWDWDAVYPHAQAGRIVRWFAALAADQAPDWLEGEDALASSQKIR